jgi:hypothetical protein
MRAFSMYILVFLTALALTGCSVTAGVSGSPALDDSASSSPIVSTSSAPAASPTPAAARAPEAMTSLATATTSDPATADIQAVIQKANQEQQDAFQKGDPSVMKDTSTSNYYDQMAQNNSDMADGGVSSIKLVKIEWGQIQLTSPTTAQATTFETWQTAYSDGSSGQGREQNVYALVLEQGVWKIQSNDHPTSSPNGSGGSTASGPSGSGAPSAPLPTVPSAPSTPAGGTDMSRNWAGYAATSGSFTAVSGSWVVPQSQSLTNLSSGATWVGIGGTHTRDLIQAGTMETTDPSGQIAYDAWVETLPQAARPVPFAVHPGDSVGVSIGKQDSGDWLIQFDNKTTGENYQTTVSYNSSLSSAEWIEEAPSSGRRILPIDNFGTIQFSGGSAIRDGKSVTIAQSGAQPITLTDPRSGSVVTPSVLTADGQGFSVSQSASTPAPQIGRRLVP